MTAFTPEEQAHRIARGLDAGLLRVVEVEPAVAGRITVVLALDEGLAHAAGALFDRITATMEAPA